MKSILQLATCIFALSNIVKAHKKVSLSSISTEHISLFSSDVQGVLEGTSKFGGHYWKNAMPWSNFKRYQDDSYDGVDCGNEQDCSYSCGYTLTLQLRRTWGTSKPRIGWSSYPSDSFLGIKFGLTGSDFHHKWLKRNFDSYEYPGSSWDAQSKLLAENDYTQRSVIILIDLGHCIGHYVGLIGRSDGGSMYLVMDNSDKLYAIKKSKIDKIRRYWCIIIRKHGAYAVG